MLFLEGGGGGGLKKLNMEAALILLVKLDSVLFASFVEDVKITQ